MPAFRIILPPASVLDRDFGTAEAEVLLGDGRRVVVTFRTLGNIERVFVNNRRSGQRCGGAYLPTPNTILVNEITDPIVHTAVRDLLESGELFTLGGGVLAETDEQLELTDPRGIMPAPRGEEPKPEPTSTWRKGKLTAHSPRGAATEQPLRVGSGDIEGLLEAHIGDWSSTLTLFGTSQRIEIYLSESKVAVAVTTEDGARYHWLSVTPLFSSVWFAMGGQLVELPQRQHIGMLDAISLAEEFVSNGAVDLVDLEWERQAAGPAKKGKR